MCISPSEEGLCGPGRTGLRVTGGQLSGRRLSVPRGRGVRPTADRVRESVFARLGPLDGWRVLDLYAGCGALGIEALSRGARSACFVEHAPPALRCLEANLASLSLEGRSRVIAGDVLRMVPRLSRSAARFDLVLADPPYAPEAARQVLEIVARSGLLGPGGLLVIESDRRHPPGEAQGLREVDRRRYGDTLVSLFTPDQEPAPGANRRAHCRTGSQDPTARPEKGRKGTTP